ncbi:MAG: amidohydrolase family protein [Candidatus Poribacteria bacterium]|nr:amidohydrolase family protein [Candidatus Poribacteria bacterium]
MPTDLAKHIQETKLVDTHEHLRKENDWVENGPDILQDLFGNYVPADLHTAGATGAAMKRLMDASDEDIAGRFEGIREAWEATQFTGYGEAVSLVAKHIYGIDELTGSAIAAAAPKTKELRQPSERHRILRDVANLDHIQTDDFCWECYPDKSGLDFFMYDLSWVGFCNGNVDLEGIHKHTGVGVTNLATLKQAMEALFDKYAPVAIAVKSQHAYNRTLDWTERSDEEASAALNDILTKDGKEIGVETRNCLGDWAWSRGAELCREHNLPFKIHTGYYAGNNRMPVSRIKAGNLCGLLSKHLDTKFVLMHIAYPYEDELIALTKHYRNVWADLCWAWSINPFASTQFVRSFIHAAPSNKLFAFGGDTSWPTSSYAYAIQAREGLNRALQGEVGDGLLTEKQAIGLATRFMRGNQFACMDVEGTRANILAANGA